MLLSEDCDSLEIEDSDVEENEDCEEMLLSEDCEDSLPVDAGALLVGGALLSEDVEAREEIEEIEDRSLSVEEATEEGVLPALEMLL